MTASGLIVLVGLTLWLAPVIVVASVFGLFLSVAAYEWAGLLGWRNGRYLYAAITACFAVVLGVGPSILGAPLLAKLATIIWSGALLAILFAQHGQDLIPRAQPILATIGWLVLLPCFALLLTLCEIDRRLVLGLMVMIWGADSSAFFIGRVWGRRRLASRVSPGKTWAGAIASLVSGAVVGVLVMLWLGGDLSDWTRGALWGALVVVASIIGDLFESLMKRRRGLKDSGTLLPGHGGVLDRIDSLLAATPVFFLGFTPLIPSP